MKSQRKARITVIAGLAVLLPLAAACSSSGSSGSGNSGGGSGKTVAFISGGKGIGFYTSMYCGIQAEAKKMGISTSQTAPDKFDPSLQTPIVEAVTAQKPDGVLIAPDDAVAMQGPVTAMAASGIKVGLVDTTLKDTSKTAFQIASDNTQGGALAADEVNKLTGGSGTVLVLTLGPGVTTDAERVAGFQAQIKKYPGLKLLPVQDTQDDATKTASIVSSTLSAQPGLKAIFATDEVSSFGAITGLQNAKATGTVKLVGFDADEKMVEAIRNGTVDATVSQSPYQIGVRGIDLMAKVMAGQSVKAANTTPLAVVTKANLDDASTQQFIYKTSC
jgi:ribose transport system substrate-binding protein